jgi:hypothetical protein
VVAASRDANADDEHDPEGSTIAFTLARMSSKSGSSPSNAPIMRQFWRALAGVAVTAAGALILGLSAESMDSWLRWPTGVLALVMFVACNVKCSDAGEYLSKAKGVYHPMYGSLGPLGLVLAVFARPTRDT